MAKKWFRVARKHSDNIPAKIFASIAIAGFAAVCAILLFFACAVYIRVPGKSAFSVVSCAVLVLSLATLELGHLGYFEGGAEPLTQLHYRLALFIVPSSFYFFGRWAILPLFAAPLPVALPIQFDIIEQTIRYAGRIDLAGGSIEIVPRDDGTSSVVMITRYELRTRWLLPIRYFIDLVVKAMHRVVMRDMRQRLVPAEDATREAGVIPPPPSLP